MNNNFYISELTKRVERLEERFELLEGYCTYLELQASHLVQQLTTGLLRNGTDGSTK